MDPYNSGDQMPPPPMTPPPSPTASFDMQQAIKTFTTPDWLIAGGSIVFLIASFLPWYTVSFNIAATSFTAAIHNSSSVNGWADWTGTFAGILAIATLVFFGAKLAGIKIPLTVSDKVIFMGLGGVMTLLSLLFWVRTNPSSTDLGLLGTSGISAGPSFGLFIGVIAGIAVAAGGYLKKA